MSRTAHPTVSVVIPTYNRADLIARSIRSVLSQSYQDFELLVVDDGSVDDTAAVVAGLADPRMRYVRLHRNIGAGPARNVGIRMSKGEFVAFQDSDDEWLPEKLAICMSVFARNPPPLGVVYSDMERMRQDGSIIYHRSPDIMSGRLIDPGRRSYQVHMLGTQSTVIRRECLAATGYFNEKLPALEDMELFIRLSKQFGFIRIPKPLVRYYETDGLSKNLGARRIARKLILKLYGRELLLHDASFLLKEISWIFKTRPRS